MNQGDQKMKTSKQSKELTTVQMTAGIFDGNQFETVHYPDDEIMLRVTSAGNVQVIEYSSTDRDGPPAHSHLWHEIEYVIEGEVEFYLNGEWIRGGPGTVQMLPAGVSHAVRVPSGSARLLYITIGAPYDGLAREVSALYAEGKANLETIRAVAHRHGLQLDGEDSETGSA
jgi:quercetin dioxygenase-like cupin family protein